MFPPEKVENRQNDKLANLLLEEPVQLAWVLDSYVIEVSQKPTANLPEYRVLYTY